jgi:two-component system nitrate/nitrite response regulator NarL
MEPNYRTVILEEESLVREGLRLILSKTPFAPAHVGEVDYRDEKLGAINPDLIIMVIRSDSDFVEQIGVLRSHHPAARIVVLGEHGYRQRLHLALEAGANGALLTSISPDGLIRALYAVVSDNVLVIDGSLGQLSAANEGGAGESNGLSSHAAIHDERKLSSREYAILDRIVLGDSNKHIARHFGIAEATVKAHVKAILRKTGVANRTQAAIWLMNNKPTEIDSHRGGTFTVDNVEYSLTAPLLSDESGQGAHRLSRREPGRPPKELRGACREVVDEGIPDALVRPDPVYLHAGTRLDSGGDHVGPTQLRHGARNLSA